MNTTSANVGPQATARLLGRQVRAWRIERGLRQSDLASRSGVGELALRRLETGAGSTLTTMLAVLEALGKLSRMKAVFDPVGVSPMQELTRNLSVSGKPKRAVSSRRRTRASRSGSSRPGRESVEKTPSGGR